MKPRRLLPDFSRRVRVRELMDDPACDRRRLLLTVRKFAFLNRLVSRYRSVLTRWVLDDMASRADGAYRVADLGAGACDIPVWLLREAARRSLRVEVMAIEANELIAADARRRHGTTAGLRIVCRDALDVGALGDVDYVVGNHFLHHLSDEQISHLLAGLADRPLRRFIFLDLLRSPWAYCLHSLVAPLIFPRTFIAEDGRRSIRSGFTAPELTDLIAVLGLEEQVEVHPIVPARFALVGRGSAVSPAYSNPAAS